MEITRVGRTLEKTASHHCLALQEPGLSDLLSTHEVRTPGAAGNSLPVSSGEGDQEKATITYNNSFVWLVFDFVLGDFFNFRIW